MKPPQDGSDTRASVASSDDPCSCILHRLELLNLRQWEPNEDCVGEVEAWQNGGDDKRLGSGERHLPPDFAGEVQLKVGGLSDIVEVLPIERYSPSVTPRVDGRRSMRRAFRVDAWTSCTRPRDSIRSKKVRPGPSGLTPTRRLKSTIISTLRAEARMGLVALENLDIKCSAGVDVGCRRWGRWVVGMHVWFVKWQREDSMIRKFRS